MPSIEVTQDVRSGRRDGRARAPARAASARRRRAAIVASLVLASFAAFMSLAVQAWQKDAFAWDTDVSETIHAYENEETVLDKFVDPFDLVLHPALQVLGVFVVIAAFAVLLRQGRQRAAAFVALGVGGIVLLGPVLKEVIARPAIDPDGGPDSFPSGHAIRSMAAAAALTVVTWPTRWRWPAAVVGAAVVVLIGIAVVYHEWHWASDVLGAWFFVIAWLGSLWLALRRSV
jgi:membrane-associated phospholipid phosphatase